MARADRYQRENAELRAKLAARPRANPGGLWMGSMFLAGAVGAAAAIAALLSARGHVVVAIQARSFEAPSFEAPLAPREDPVVVSQGVATIPIDDDLPVIHPEGSPVYFVKNTVKRDSRGDPLRNADTAKRATRR